MLLGLAGMVGSAAARPVGAASTLVVVSPALGGQDFLSPMRCTPSSPCASVSPASAPARRIIAPLKAAASDAAVLP